LSYNSNATAATPQIFTAVDNTTGLPLAGGQLYTYASGTITPQATYTDNTLTTQLPNPVILDNYGQAVIWLGPNPYRFNLLNTAGVQQAHYPQDNIQSSSAFANFTAQLAAFSTPSQGQGLIGFNSALSYPANTLPNSLASTTSPVNGSGMVGYNPVVAYAAGTVGAALNGAFTSSAVQSQTATFAVTGGTAPAFTATLNPAPTALVTGLRCSIYVAAAGTTGSNTFNLNALGAEQVYQFGAGGVSDLRPGNMPPGAYLDLEYNANISAWLILNPVYATRQIQSLTAAVSANALAVGLSPSTLNFRSATLGSGVISELSNYSALALTVPSGATLGTVSGVQSTIAVLALNNAGTIVFGVVNLAGGVNLDETTLISTTAISAGATSASTVYSTAGLASVPFRVVGYTTSTQAAAGTWASAPSLVQGEGGQAMASMQSLGMGQTWQNVTGSRAFSIVYYNTTSRPIFVYPSWSNTFNTTVPFTINGVTAGNMNGYGTSSGGGFIVPPGTSYSVLASQTLTTWFELR